MTGHEAHATIETIAAFVLVVGGAIVLTLAARQRRRLLGLEFSTEVDPASVEPGDRPALSIPAGVAVALSLGAAAIHLAAGPSHVEELGDLGLGFYWAALFQGGWAIAYAMRPSVRLGWIGICGNLAISAAWAWSRTVGLPVGPQAWRPEAIGVPDAMATVFQVLLAGILFVTVVSATRSRRGTPERRRGSAGLVAGVPIVGIVFLATTLAVATATAGHDHRVPTDHTATHVAGAISP